MCLAIAEEGVCSFLTHGNYSIHDKMGQPYLIKFRIQGFLLNLSLVFGLLSHVWFQPAERRHERLLGVRFND